MEEKVGHCAECQKPIYCYDGFLNGVITGDNKLICFRCDEVAEG